MKNLLIVINLLFITNLFGQITQKSSSGKWEEMGETKNDYLGLYIKLVKKADIYKMEIEGNYANYFVFFDESKNELSDFVRILNDNMKEDSKIGFMEVENPHFNIYFHFSQYNDPNQVKISFKDKYSKYNIKYSDYDDTYTIYLNKFDFVSLFGKFIVNLNQN